MEREKEGSKESKRESRRAEAVREGYLRGKLTCPGGGWGQQTGAKGTAVHLVMTFLHHRGHWPTHNCARCRHANGEGTHHHKKRGKSFGQKEKTAKEILDLDKEPWK